MDDGLKKQQMILIGTVLLVAAVIWAMSVVPEIRKIPMDYGQKITAVHTENARYAIGGDWTGEIPSVSTFEIKTLHADREKSVINSEFTVMGLNGDLIYWLGRNLVVDRSTGHNLACDSDLQGEAYFFFPRNTQKTHYIFWPAAYATPVLLQYQGTEMMGGIETYHFATLGFTGEDTGSNPSLQVDQSKYRVFSTSDINVFVEPITGMIINYMDKGTTYYVDAATTVKVQDAGLWSDAYDAGTITQLAKAASERIGAIYLYEVVIPYAFGMAGVISLWYAFGSRKGTGRR